ncbi:MAG: hypothetical protein KKC20_07740 [Proteobacteria bacterium]|nr:hypothetical protein [Pseudomonadota bacterium]
MATAFASEIKLKSLSKAIENQNFRQALLSNPKEAVKEELGLEIPDGKTLHVLEQAPGQHALVILQRPEGIPEGATVKDIKELLAKDMPKLSEQLSSRMESYVNVLAKTWADPEFKNQLLKNPETVLRDENYGAMDENPVISVKVEDDENEYLVLPAMGSDSELTDEELELISGGGVLLTIGLLLAGAGATPLICAVGGVIVALCSW